MRLLTLYARARGVPTAAAVALVGTTALWALAVLTDNPLTRLMLAVLAATVAAAALGPGLAGADVDLDRTAALPWRPRRVAHLVAGAAVVTGLLAATALTGEPFAESVVLARDTAGLVGLTALGAVVFGASKAWILPVAWSAVNVMTGGPMAGAWYKEVLTFMVQPAGTTSATVTATALAGAGTLAYAVFGSRK
jgi:hypothetical protein